MESSLYLGHIPQYSHDEIDLALVEDDRDILIFAGISSAYYDSDWIYTQDLCIRLYEHPNKTVRGNAILGLAMIARNEGRLDQDAAEPTLIRALKDPEPEVRMRAEDAIREINSVLNWSVARNK
jgi:HEAT repeat protein